MARAHVEQDLPARAEKVWSLIQDFTDMASWASEDMSVSRSEGSGKGAMRWVETPQGQFVERCESYEPSSWTFSYSVTDGPPHLESYLATVALRPDGEHRCIITWSSVFEIRGMEDADAVKLIESTFRDKFITNLTHSLTADREGP